jgi:hypothetical protein
MIRPGSEADPLGPGRLRPAGEIFFVFLDDQGFSGGPKAGD